MREWPFQWKMQFNSDPNKQANEFLFSKKPNNCVQLGESQKHLGFILDKHLNIHEHIERKIETFNKQIGTLKYLFIHLPRKCLLRI